MIFCGSAPVLVLASRLLRICVRTPYYNYNRIDIYFQTEYSIVIITENYVFPQNVLLCCFVQDSKTHPSKPAASLSIMQYRLMVHNLGF